MTDSEILRRTRDMIAKPEHWTQTGDFAVDKHGSAVPLNSSKACGWCIMGAFMVVSDSTYNAELLLVSFMPKYQHHSENPSELIAWLNDHPTTTHTDVMIWFDAAIKVAQARETA
jgi:hypothetical protein